MLLHLVTWARNRVRVWREIRASRRRAEIRASLQLGRPE
jgi:hypothetical protein